jgi:hypothetical protein
MRMKPKLVTSFSSQIKHMVTREKDAFLAKASLAEIQKFIPEVDTDKNYDLVPIAFNACVVNRVNKNSDVIDTKTALALYETFINKPINIEHDRKKVIGCILTAGFSEFGTDRPLDLEDVKDRITPFNITLGGILWRAVNNGVASLVEDAANPQFDEYLSISASWELGFTDYNVVVIRGESKDLSDAKIISDPKQVEELTPKLSAYGGTGKLDDDEYIYRQMTNDVLAMGVGLTESPAAEVKGIAVKPENETKADIDKLVEEAVLRAIVKHLKPESLLYQEKIQNNANQISQPENITVKDNSIISMKITSLKDITDDLLKQVKASAVSDFIEEQLREADKKFTAEKAEKEKALEIQKNVASELEKAKDELKKIQASLEELKKAQAEREALEVFTSRMSAFDTAYDLNADDRKVLASQIKGMTVEAFAEYEKQVAVLMNEKSKAVKKAAIEAAEAAKKQVVEAKASTDDATKVVDDAVEKAKVKTPAVPATAPGGSPSMREKYASAFSVENFIIKK